MWDKAILRNRGNAIGKLHSPLRKRAWLTEVGADRGVRGGGWDGFALDMRAAYRDWFDPYDRSTYIGFRCLSSGVSLADGMRRERRRAESGAREDRDRSDDGGR